MKTIKQYRVIEGEIEKAITLYQNFDGEYKLVVSEGIADDYAWLYDNPPSPTICEYVFGDPSDAVDAFKKAVAEFENIVL